ncbi:NAD(P)-dependent oxidoreductase [Chelativorans sp. M5D2P16]|uniref:NAD(P)-dependent oxidoreductase n=1 Tax=Chelativorans sp. M5D2P16 TaxID=3095678 RepID=UPI002ACA0E45|nr:NAD(P)-dependent oxidoreductase [Chelativorans sp. M5D2P16]MDZ5699484.1 NAD(P)-dependent oxidoreductase [Chelativorans sp. M5D2P16]
MSSHPILLIGGSGVVGRRAARYLREAHPEVPLLIAGRDLAKARKAAAGIGRAEGVRLDLAVDGLGLGARPVSAVAVLFADERMAGLRFAQSRGVPYISISPLLQEIGPEVGGYIHRPGAAPVVLGTEWLVGATTVPTLEFAKAYGRLDSISIGALLDDEDTGGPAQTVDLERVTKTAPAALARRKGRFVWRVGDDATATIRAVDGTRMDASALSPNDVVGLAMATGAPNVEFNLATGVSSTRRRGEPMSTEIIIDLAGEDHEGRPLCTRHAVVHPEGQFPLTGLGVAMVLERATGLAGGPAVPAGLYFPYQLLDPDAYFTRLEQIGGRVLTLDLQ